MTRDERLRRRRCLALLVAVAFGVALPITTPSRVTLVAAALGIAAALVTYWRECRRGADSRPGDGGDPAREAESEAPEAK